MHDDGAKSADITSKNEYEPAHSLCLSSAFHYPQTRAFPAPAKPE
jgi:hypothetical protein